MPLNLGSCTPRAVLATPKALPARKFQLSQSLRRPAYPTPTLRSRSTLPTGRRSLTTVAATKAKFGSFQEMLSQSELVLVDFYATWCGPCVMMGHILEEAKKRVKNVTFAKIDTEKFPGIASQFGVTALPTLVLFKRGQPIARFEGVMIAVELERWINQAVQGAKR